MLRIFDKQSTGKTKQLVQFAKANNCTIVCALPLRMQDKAIRYGVGHVECISYEELLANYATKSLEVKDYVIDEPERLMCLMFQNGARLCGYDMTTEY